MIIKLTDRYINLANIKYTSIISNESFITLYFNDGTEHRVIGNDIKILKEKLEEASKTHLSVSDFQEDFK